jgi:hypothetical protein
MAGFMLGASSPYATGVALDTNYSDAFDKIRVSNGGASMLASNSTSAWDLMVDTVVGTWSVGDGTTSWGLANMRHAAIARNGRYLLTYGVTPPTGFMQVNIKYAPSAADIFTLGVKFSGSTPCKVFVDGNYHYNTRSNTTVANAANVTAGIARVYNSTGMTCVADVHADTTGTKFWQDTVNNIVWVRIKGGILTGQAPSLTSGFTLVVNTA